jgi:hypothetical protein
LEECSRLVIIGQIDTVEPMSTIPTISRDRSRPAAMAKPRGTVLSPLECRIMFDIRGTDICWPHGVKIEREPVASDNVPVRCGGFDAFLEPIRRTSEERGSTGIEGAIHGGRFAAPLLCCLGKRL